MTTSPLCLRVTVAMSPDRPALQRFDSNEWASPSFSHIRISVESGIPKDPKDTDARAVQGVVSRTVAEAGPPEHVEPCQNDRLNEGIERCGLVGESRGSLQQAGSPPRLPPSMSLLSELEVESCETTG